MAFAHFVLAAVCLIHISTSNTLQQCCPNPVASFRRKEFAGACACQSLSQKWNRFSDWIQLSGGYIHPALRLDYVHNYQGMDSAFYSFERGLFANFDTKNQSIPAFETLVTLPMNTVMSQLIVSKYIIKAPKSHQHSQLFSTPQYFMPDAFPTWEQFISEIISDKYDYPSQDAWLALGFAWLREYTDELLPWFELLPSTEYLPNTWSSQQRLSLLNGTEALKLINFSDLIFSKAIPYIEMLGLTETQVRDAFALLQSRFFATDLSHMGGDKNGLFGCGIDFGNHNASVDSSVQLQVIMDESVGNVTHPLTDSDFKEVSWYIDHDIINRTEIFNNYGQHNSAEMFSLFGFIVDNYEDYYTFHINVPLNDLNYNIKMRYFERVWQLHDPYNNIVSKHPGINYGNSLFLNGQSKMEMNDIMLRKLRLTYLSQKYFDSFTISSVLNFFESNYLQSVVDPLVIEEIHNVCDELLKQYPTSYREDETDLKRLELEKNGIINALKVNRNKDLDTTAKLSDELSKVNTHMVVLRYRMKEKQFLMQPFHEFEYDDFPCVDTDEDCSNWSDEYECDINPEWMQLYCARSCNTCSLQSMTFRKKYSYKTHV